MLRFTCGISIIQKGEIVIGNTALIRPALSGFAAFAVVEIQRHVFTGVAIQPAIITLAAVEKKLVLTHS
jgi:hypothetical protein